MLPGKTGSSLLDLLTIAALAWDLWNVRMRSLCSSKHSTAPEPMRPNRSFLSFHSLVIALCPLLISYFCSQDTARMLNKRP